MSPATLESVIEQLRSRAEANPAFADTLEHLVTDDVVDPFARVDDQVRAIARLVNRRRQVSRAEELRVRALTTAEVVDLLPSVSDRKGVDRRRHRGTLLGLKVGNQTLHPVWQFDRRRRDVHEGLERVLAALREVAVDDVDVDAVAVAEWADLGGRSIADLLAAGDVDLAVQIAMLAGDQS